jgi:penicillin amidase
MHLGLGVPNTWYRARLEYAGGFVEGVTLPGSPGVIAGSNGDIAWTFTNLCADLEDYVVVETVPGDDTRYLTPEGSEAFTDELEHIEIKGAPYDVLALKVTRWGVVSATDHENRPLAFKWAALEKGAVNVGLFDMAGARTLQDALAVARRWRGPPQNVIVADARGRIGWTIAGWIPVRQGFDGSTPVSWAKPGVGWTGALPDDQRPTIVDPRDGVLFTANNRTLDEARARSMGAVWTNGHRARRIGELLRASDDVDESAMLAIQLDTRAEPYDYFKDVVLKAVPEADPDPAVARARDLRASWNGRADADQPGYRILRRFIRQMERVAFEPVIARCRERMKDFAWTTFMKDEPLRRLLEARPANWLPEGVDSWDAFVAQQFRATVRAIESDTREPGGVELPWGQSNATRINHVITRAVPALSFLNMPSQPQPGDNQTVRVATPGFGASQRVAVSPGREDSGIAHMPCGQSGHPLSRHYRDAHADWMNGAPTPFSAGPAVRRLVLRPAAAP